MKFNPEKHHRRSIRLQKFNYSSGNVFFVTICSYQKECLFGTILDFQMNLNALGECIKIAWLETALKRSNISLDDFVIMPNHFHAIVWISRRGTACRAPDLKRDATTRAQHAVPLRDHSSLNQDQAHIFEQFGKPVCSSLPTIIRSFKSAATKLINENRNTPEAPVWQRNYYEHIIRSRKELKKTSEYIHSNPAHWNDDEENPAYSNS